MAMFSKALIIEDLPDAQTWLSSVLGDAFPGISVAIAATAAEARTQLARDRPPLALVDLNLPDGSGIELLPLVRLADPEAIAIVTTIYDDEAHIFPALRAGAQGYLLKDEPRESLVRQLRTLSRGELPLSPSVAKMVLRHFAPADALAGTANLTAKERAVLAAVAEGLTVGDAAKRLGVARNTVSTHIKHIYAKLSISSRAEAARIAAQLGIVGQVT